uniref:Uncharacterized protein n=1 Tax=Rhizophora mucronata TaxID=61149 RepID=A0A2P2PMR9_RHIMU
MYVCLSFFFLIVFFPIRHWFAFPYTLVHKTPTIQDWSFSVSGLHLLFGVAIFLTYWI